MTLAALLCGAAASLQAYPRGTPLMADVSAIVENGIQTVEVGTPQKVAMSRLGKQHRNLTDTILLFEGYKPSHEHLADHDCNKLLVSFENGRVARMSVVNPEAVTIVVSHPDSYTREPGTMIAQK
jgi:hypothetical protein